MRDVANAAETPVVALRFKQNLSGKRRSKRSLQFVSISTPTKACLIAVEEEIAITAARVASRLEERRTPDQRVINWRRELN